jgi:hypothetical protein
MKAATDNQKLKLYVAKITKPARAGFLFKFNILSISMV